MKILHLATHEGSGAGRATLRLHLGLMNQTINSLMLVVQKYSHYPSVIKLDNQTIFLKKIQSKILGQTLSQIVGHNTTFSINTTPSLILNSIKNLTPSIINLHWIGWEFLRIEDLESFNVPIVWTLQDMWPFTGGCHYSEDCDRYTKSCGACPQLKSNQEADLSRWVWQRKAKAWHNLNLTIVAPSQWMANCARSSSLFQNVRTEVIPFCLDTKKFQPLPRSQARQRLNLPQNKQLILFGALSATEDKRKGFQLLISALKSLSQSNWEEKIEVVIFGSSQPDKPIDLRFKTHYLGSLNDELLKQAYSAADVMIVPSIQESFGQTASEALACGTPVVAFNGTGLKDIVDHQISGYLVQPYEIKDLAQGIAWILEDKTRHHQLCINARQSAVDKFSLNIQARRYISLYSELLEQQKIKKLSVFGHSY